MTFVEVWKIKRELAVASPTSLLDGTDGVKFAEHLYMSERRLT